MYKNYAEFYAETYRNFQGDFPSLKKFAELCPEGTILDLGAGTGRTISAFPSREQVLLECADEMLEQLIPLSEKNPLLKVVKGSALNIPLADESVVGAFSAFGSIAEMQPDLFALLEIHRVLKTGGLFYFLIPNPAAYRSGSLGVRRSKGLKVPHSVETFPVPALGPHEQITMVQLRGEYCASFSIGQCYPPFEYWVQNLRHVGFEVAEVFGHIDNRPFDEATSPLIAMIARKLPTERAQSAEQASAAKSSEPRTQSEATSFIYDQFASKYDSIVINGDYEVPRWLSEKLKPYAGLSPVVLDLACANGYIGKVLHENGVVPCSLFGLDISKEMVAQCKASGVYTGVAVADLSLPLPIAKSSFFDLVTCCGLQEFVESPLLTLKEIRRVLNIGGEAFVTFEASANDQDIVISKMIVGNDQVARKAVSKNQIEKWAAESNLEIVSIEKRTAYRSPTSGQTVDYHFCQFLKRGDA